MKTLFVPVKSGFIKYVHYSEQTFKDYVEQFMQPHCIQHVQDCMNPTSIWYCVPQYNAWLTNEQLKQGWVLIGTDGESWLFIKPENILTVPTDSH